MKKNKYIIIIFLALIISVTGFLVLNVKKNNSQTFFIREDVVTRTETQNNISNATKDIKEDDDSNNITLSLNTPDKSYIVKVEEGVNVYDVMKSAQNDGFSFNGKEYPGLGFFVEEINGIKGENGKYWMYYVNNKEAEVGISKYIIKDGDIINWKLK